MPTKRKAPGKAKPVRKLNKQSGTGNFGDKSIKKKAPGRTTRKKK